MNVMKRRIFITLLTACFAFTLESIPSNSVIQVGTTVTLSSSSSTINAEIETATAVITLTYVSIGNSGDSASITAIRTSAGDPGVTPRFRTPRPADSSNAVSIFADGTTGWVDASPDKVIEGVFYFDLVKPLYSGTYTYTFYVVLHSPGTTPTPPAPVSFTVSVVGGQTRTPTPTPEPPITLTVTNSLSLTTQGGDVILGEGTATALLSLRYQSLSDPDSFAVTAVRTAGATSPGGTVGFRSPVGSDSGSALRMVVTSTTAWVDGKPNETVTALFRFDVIEPTNPGTYTYTFYATYQGGVYPTSLPAPVTMTFTVKRQTSMLVSVAGSLQRGSAITVTAVTQAAGVIEFRENGRVIKGCSAKSIDLSTLEASCTWRPKRHGVATISLFYDSSDSAWADFRRAINLNVQKRSAR